MTDRELLELIVQKVTGLEKRIDHMDEHIGHMDEHIGHMDDHIGSMDERLTNLERTVIRIESNHGEKLSALFDGYNFHNQRFDRIEERLDRIEEKITSHDIQIHVLDRTKSNKRKTR